MVILENSLTVAERNLVALGEHQRLREARLFFQYSLEEQLGGLSRRRSAGARSRSSAASTPSATWRWRCSHSSRRRWRSRSATSLRQG